ncbi:DMT family transporter [Liquorilactobacillus sicerae]|uniref:DMT family transporter n=1 Tax=Liquorilactobacillus sicerae TaxID=1416943 RepID=UPI002481869E|nr:EamA family transporter [Liquorilactobacillus sicerae]
MKKQVNFGILLAVIACILWGVAGPVSQFLLQKAAIPVTWLLGMKMMLTAVILLPIAAYCDPQNWLKIWQHPLDILRLIFYAAVGLAGVQFTYLLTVQSSDAATTTILQTLHTVLIIFYVAIFCHQHPSRQEWLAVFCALIGTWLLVTRGALTQLSISPSTVLFGTGLIFTDAALTLAPMKLIERYSPLTVLGWGMLIAGTFSQIIQPAWKSTPHFSLLSLLALLFVAFGGTALSYLLYLQSLKHITPTMASLLDTLEPLTATLGTVLFMNVNFNLVQFIGAGLILSTVFILALGHQVKRSIDHSFEA